MTTNRTTTADRVEQVVERPSSPVWSTRLTIFAATLATSIAGTYVYAVSLAAGGWNVFEVAATPLFCLLFTWLAFSFFVATAGFLRSLSLWRRGRRDAGDTGPGSAVQVNRLDGDATMSVDAHQETSPTAVLVPVYNEDPDDVFARVGAMVRSLRQQGRIDQVDRSGEFHFYVLSDTTAPETWLLEESAWNRLCRQLADEFPNTSPNVFYRHRSDNRARKAGNIADFCERWSAPYQCMIVLDADSLLQPTTMIAMVDQMRCDPELGILQVPPAPIGRESLFARIQQFSAAAYGHICCRGFDAWAGDQGNYWGHNAILRVRAFRDSCDLPVLPGRAPMGGEILSHDFVEAALMVRDRWKVRLANDLGGSYEECPTVLTDYAKRDQRWCQGNLQHSYLLVSEGFHAVSRLHFFSGILAYAASPIWLLWTVLAVAAWTTQSPLKAGGAPVGSTQLILFLVAGVFLLLPKLYGVLATMAHGKSEQFGGWRRLAVSALIETLVSILLSPLMALLHSRFVITSLLGRQVKWNAQNRCERGVSLKESARDYGWHMALGVTLTAAVATWAMPLMFWLAPLLVGLVLAVPLAMVLGNQTVGRWLMQRGLLLIPEERCVPEVYQRYQQALHENRRETAGQTRPRFQQLIERDDLFRLHEQVLTAGGGGVALSVSEKDKIRSYAVFGTQCIPVADRRAILSDQALLDELHRDHRLQAT